ncbi:MAG TPA: fatty acid desaturase, partial [Alphaproteobacteria bacterium]|nr:fatty acid desaturase [Alphaproteobacteria bacterium]
LVYTGSIVSGPPLHMSADPSRALPASTSDDPRYFIDWPTLLLAIGIYGAFAAVTLSYHVLPWWVVLPLGTVIVCLHGSLQHEATHGFPTRWEPLNSCIVGLPLWLWLPYLSYRQTHRTHHQDENLTNPEIDPESNYLTAAQIAAMSPLRRWVRERMRTLGGRILFGPAYFCFFSWREKLIALANGDWQRLRPLMWHIPGVALVLYWVIGVCDIPFWAYVAFFAYPGTSLTLVRSYAEHRAAGAVEQRTVICEAGSFWNLVFLYNNLHLIHHRYPRQVWHARPRQYEMEKAELLRHADYYRLPGYGTVFANWLLTPKEPMQHPLEAEIVRRRAA